MKKVRLILCSFLALLMMVLTAPVITKAATEPVCLKKATLRYLKWTNYVVDGREKFLQSHGIHCTLETYPVQPL